MDPKTTELVEYVEKYYTTYPDVDEPSDGDVLDLCAALREQDKRIADLDESMRRSHAKLGGLSEVLAAYGLPSEPKALAGAIERERSANRERIAELEKPITGDVVPTNENFVRVAMTEHCAPSAMDDRYIQEWSRRFGPALDIVRARVAFKVNELEGKLAEAIDLAGEAIPYVSDYFRTKYEMDARLAKLLPDQNADKASEGQVVGKSGPNGG